MAAPPSVPVTPAQQALLNTLTTVPPVPGIPGFAPAPVKSQENLGVFALAVADAPVQTLTVTGVLLGGLIGGFIGWVGSGAIEKRSMKPWAIAAGAALGGALAGFEGYREGQELNQWLSEHS